MSQTNGHKNNGSQTKGNGANIGVIPEKEKPNQSQGENVSSLFNPHEQGVVMRQSPTWSRGVVWTIMGVTTAVIIWAAVAPIEQVIPAKGQLKPQGTVKEIQAPINGVVEKVLVEDGDHVKKGQTLVIFDSTASQAELDSLKKIKRAVEQENRFYEALMNENINPYQLEQEIVKLQIPKEVASLARNRLALLTENQLFRVQLGESVADTQLTAEQMSRLEAARKELVSRSEAARLEMKQLEKQLSQNQVQLADAQAQLRQDRAVLAEIKARNEKTIVQLEAALKIDQDILNDIKPLGEEGALARYQINKQQQSINDRIASIVEQKANGQVEYEKQLQQIQARLAEVEKLQEEEKRLRFAINQAAEKYKNTTAISEKDVRDKMAENSKRIAEVDSQLTKIIVDNKNKISELNSQISRAEQTLKYQELKSPVTGTVFDLKAAPGFVPQPSQAEALLKIVPDDYLIAEVDITNEDIGFVRKGMKADIRIDSFPFSQYGDIKGKVLSIGSDALPPDEIHKYYRFPAKIQLDDQKLRIGEREIPLQSGMSVSVNIKVRENRTVLSLFLEQFTKSVETLKEVQ